MDKLTGKNVVSEAIALKRYIYIYIIISISVSIDSNDRYNTMYTNDNLH